MKIFEIKAQEILSQVNFSVLIGGPCGSGKSSIIHDLVYKGRKQNKWEGGIM